MSTNMLHPSMSQPAKQVGPPISHYPCCKELIGLCGWECAEIVPEDSEDQLCVVCEDLAKDASFCPLEGQSCDRKPIRR